MGKNKKKTLEDLAKLAKILRSPKGCPWDREQTIETILKCSDDEIEEVRLAVNNKDFENLKEELGDVLFHIVMMSQMANEKKHFDINDVVEGIYKKIRSRHTWVFGKDKAKNAHGAVKMWKKNKVKEKHHVHTGKKMGGKK